MTWSWTLTPGWIELLSLRYRGQPCFLELSLSPSQLHLDSAPGTPDSGRCSTGESGLNQFD